MSPFEFGQAVDPFQAPKEEPAQSLVATVFDVPEACEPCRVESTFTVLIGGKLYRFVARDRVVPEDPYLVAIKAAAYSLARTEEYRGTPPPRSVRDFLVKADIVI